MSCGQRVSSAWLTTTRGLVSTTGPDLHPSCGQPLVTRLQGRAGTQAGRQRGRFFLVPTCLSLLPQVIELPVTERQIEREHLIQLRRWQETRGELQCCSPPRLHGAKAILEAEPGPRPTLQPSPSIRLPPDALLPGSKSKPKPPKQIPKEQQKREKASGQLDKTPTPGQAKMAIAGGDACPPQDVPPKDPVHQDPSPQDSAPQVPAHHCSQESLVSQESEDTYL